MTTSESRRVVIVTGANCGIGFRASEFLAKKRYQVILACRSRPKAEEAVEKIKKHNPDALVSYNLLDLADKESVDKFAEWFLSTDLQLHALVNNGGILRSDAPRETTKDGFETTFGTNHLGHFLLTMLLLDKLKETARTCGNARIVNVASGWHNAERVNGTGMTNRVIGPLDLNDLNLEQPNAYHGLQAYKNSKAANILFTKALARSLESSNVVALAMCPGFIPTTNIFREFGLGRSEMDNGGGSKAPTQLQNSTAKTTDFGAQHIVDLVDDDKFLTKSGIYYKNFQETECSEEVNDVGIQNGLWLKSCEMLDRRYENVLKQ